MRHKKKFNHLSRTSAHRKAMLSNMAASLIVHKRITTTVAKAKALRVYVEPLITRSKEDTTHQRRMVFRKLQDKVAVAELFREVSVKVAERPGGYTRIIKLGNRLGDNADMCMIELVDFNENLLGLDKKAPAKAKSTRRRSGTKKAVAPAAEKPAAKAPEAVEDVVEEVVTETPEAIVEDVAEDVVTETPEAIVEEVVEEVVNEVPEAVVETIEEEVVAEAPAEVVEPEATTEVKAEADEATDTPEVADDDLEKETK
jgi:large subunit ribosomal protein L17